jgi:hypothetical protein
MQFYVLWEIISNFTPFIYGASLCALSKKDGGIRPIQKRTPDVTFRGLSLNCQMSSGTIRKLTKCYFLIKIDTMSKVKQVLQALPLFGKKNTFL